jgi:25S rRNA (cytosine2278-C5)-methyltransferase
MQISEKFANDPHIPNLLIFNATSSLHQTDAYLSGKIILQDKASCMPAVILAPPASDDAVVIDATAAPGNKTSHLSALMKNRGKVCFHSQPVAVRI